MSYARMGDWSPRHSYACAKAPIHYVNLFCSTGCAALVHPLPEPTRQKGIDMRIQLRDITKDEEWRGLFWIWWGLDLPEYRARFHPCGGTDRGLAVIAGLVFVPSWWLLLRELSRTLEVERGSH
jgi:hypothetical protein